MIVQPHGSDALAHHAANAAAIAMPLGSLVLGLSPYLTVVLTIAGLAWYGVLFYDRFIGKQKEDLNASPDVDNTSPH